MPTMGVPETDPITQLSLPPGFRFHPTDEELLVQYLCRKVAENHFPMQIIGEIDLYKFDPWDLPSRALFGEKEWYFFSPRDRKYPNGTRPNRVAGSGYWKATGTDKIITSDGRKVGIKKALVFYVGKAPKGTKTNWIMHEYRLLENHRKNGSTKLDDWVLCRIYKKNSSSQKPAMANFPSKLEHSSNNGESSSSSSQLDDVMLESFPQLDDRFFSLPRMNSLKTNQNDVKTEFPSFGSGNFDWGSFAGSEFGSGVQTQARSQVIPGPGPGYVPSSIPPVGQVDFSVNRGRNAVEEEVQSGVNTRGGDNSGFFQQDHGVLTQNFSNSVDPFGFRYPTQTGGFGYRQ